VRRKVDVRKLKYTPPSGELIAVFPDTLSSIIDYYVKYPVDATYKLSNEQFDNVCRIINRIGAAHYTFIFHLRICGKERNRNL
jgi:50S ribosomal subunit-associated GTPase HflX